MNPVPYVIMISFMFFSALFCKRRWTAKLQKKTYIFISFSKKISKSKLKLLKKENDT